MTRQNAGAISFGFLLLAFSAPTPAEEHFLQIAPASSSVPDGQTDGDKKALYPKRPNLYWKAVVNGDKVLVYDLCDGGKQPIGTATGTAKKWVFEGQLGRQTTEIDEDGVVVITAGGYLYANGHEILPIACDPVKKLPTTQPILVTKAPEKSSTSSGFRHVNAARGKTLMVERAVSPTPGKPDTTDAIPAGTLMCKTAPAVEAAVRDLTDAPALALNPQLWPGNLIRGKDLAKGQFTPITAKRSSGTLTIAGLTFEDTAEKPALYSADVKRMSGANVSAAINTLLSQPVSATQATVSFVTSTVYSLDQLAFSLGVDGRFGQGSFATTLKVDTSSKKNSVLARFTQIYYTVSFEDPESAYSVFDKEENFKDDENQIGADNPPLYIKQIGYGRTIYFLASSTESATAVKAALEGAYGNKDAGNYIGVAASADYKSVMANTSVSYFVMGGDAVSAVKPIETSDPQNMYEAVRKVMADAGSAQVTKSNRGLPISYSINYLTTRSPASMGYATSYDQSNCTIIPPGYYSFSMEQTCVDDSVTVSVTDKLKMEKVVVKMGQGFSGREFINLDAFIPQKDEDVTVRILEYNVAGPWCSNFKIKRTFKDPRTEKLETLYLQNNGQLGTTEYEIRKSGGWLVGNQSDFQFLVNRVTGAIQVIQP